MAYRFAPIGDAIKAGSFTEAAERLIAALVESKGSQTEAAKKLGIEARTVRRYLQRLELEGFDVRGEVRKKLDGAGKAA